MSTTFFLIRHAIKEKAIGDVPITQKGALQAQLTAKRFLNLPITFILSSPLRRAKETAEYIAAGTNSTIHVDNRLRERAKLGGLARANF